MLWRTEERDGKPTKVPYNPQGWKASSTARHTWSPFEEVRKAYLAGDWDGIGFVLTPPFVGTDLDECISEDGTISEKATEILRRLNSYSERSPSTKGIHNIAKGELPVSGRKKGNFEMYQSGRYFTVTGDRLEDYPATIESRPAEILGVFKELFGEVEPELEQGKAEVSHRSEPVGITPELAERLGGLFDADPAFKARYMEPAPVRKRSSREFSLCRDLWAAGFNEGEIYAIMTAGPQEKWKDRDGKYRWSTIKSAIKAEKEGQAGGAGEEEASRGAEEPVDLPPCDISELLKVFKKWLHIEEDYNVVAPGCAVSANFTPGEPDIIGLIQPSGSTKTELIRSLGETQNRYVYPISSITEHTLVSGHKESRDLLPQLKGRLLAIKDLTNILSKKEDVRSQIFADFREITDGYLRKEFGNGVAKEYRDLHSSILFASTNAIERYYSMYANLGQRIIFLRPRNDSEKARDKAFQNRGKQKEMRQELHDAMMRFISSTKALIESKGLPSTPEEVQERMGPFYDFLAIARTPIHRDYRTDEIDEIPEPEFPTRICNTIGRLCEVHALLYGREEVGPDDIAFGLRIVLDNIPTRRWQVLKAMDSGWLSTSNIAVNADMSTEGTRRTLDELISLKLVNRWVREDKPEGMDKRSDSYKISDKWLKIVEELRGGIRCDGAIDVEKETERDSSIEEEYTVITNSPPQSLIIIPSVAGGLEADLIRAEELAGAKEERFKTLVKNDPSKNEVLSKVFAALQAEGAKDITPFILAAELWRRHGVRVELWKAEAWLEWGPWPETEAEDEAAYFARVDGFTAKLAATTPILTGEEVGA